MTTVSTTREEIRAELAATRAAFHEILGGLSDADWRRDTANPGWNVGHLLHHLTWSLEVLPREVASARRSQGMYNLPPALGNPLSAAITRWGARRHSLASIARRYDAAYAAVLQTLDEVRDDEWRQGAPFWGKGYIDIEGLFRAQAHHIVEHGGQIAATTPPGAATATPASPTRQGNA